MLILRRLFWKVVIIAVIILCSLAYPCLGEQEVMTGMIAGVDRERGRITLLTGEGRIELELFDDALILRNGVPVSLFALRPITPVDFQEARVYLEEGRVRAVEACYGVMELEYVQQRGDRIVGRDMEKGQLVEFQLEEETAIVRNGIPVSAARLQTGDRLLLITGINQQVLKLKATGDYSQGTIVDPEPEVGLLLLDKGLFPLAEELVVMEGEELKFYQSLEAGDQTILEFNQRGEVIMISLTSSPLVQ